jgi:hypothetical protein
LITGAKLKDNTAQAFIKEPDKSLAAKIVVLLRNVLGIILLIASSFLLAVLTGQMSIEITDNTLYYAGGKIMGCLISASFPAIICLAGLALRRFNRWKRDVGLVFLLGWILYLPDMFATMILLLNKDEVAYQAIFKVWPSEGKSFVAFSFISRIIWVANLLLAIYFIRADRKLMKRDKINP